MSYLLDLMGRVRAWPIAIEPLVLGALVICGASAWAFIATAEMALESEPHGFDRWLITQLRDPNDSAVPIGPIWMQEVARDVTALGGVTWVTFATATIAIYLLMDGKRRIALFLVFAVTSGALLNVVLKDLFDRPRPTLVSHLSPTYLSSFPSGHSMLAAVVYLTLGTLLASVIADVALRIYVMSLAVILSVAVGATRVYLGVHYPTDVLAGWLAGLVWALLCWTVARIFMPSELMLRTSSSHATKSSVPLCK